MAKANKIKTVNLMVYTPASKIEKEVVEWHQFWVDQWEKNWVLPQNQGDKTSEIENSLFIAYNALLQGRLNDVKTAITHSIMWVKKAKAEK